jgi:hypothetical protein
MGQRISISIVLATIFGLTSEISHAALVNRGGGLIYDSVLNITWMQNANLLAVTLPETCHVGPEGEFCFPNPANDSGRRTWAEANTWADGLEYYDSERDMTWDDWRLPTVAPIDGSSFQLNFTTNGTSDEGYAKTTTNGSDGGWRDGSGTPTSELGHLFYVSLGNPGGCTPNDISPGSCTNQSPNGFLNTGDFTNVPPDEPGWAFWVGTAIDDPTNPLTAWVFDPGSGFQAHNQSPDREWLAWVVRDGDVGAVPIPAAAWLFGSALLGLGVVKRRKA